MNIDKIIDTPYSDRYCGNCSSCIKDKYNYCMHNNCFVVSGKWCADWMPEPREYKFEK